jgi:tight adherence protein C
MEFYLIISFIFLSTFLLVFIMLYLYSQAKDPIKQRLGGLRDQEVSAKDRRRSLPVTGLFSFGEEQAKKSATRVWLMKAGYRKAQSVSNYYGIRLFSTLIFGLAGAFITYTLHFKSSDMAAVVFLSLLVGWFLPTLWVMKKIISRREQIRRAVPNMLDLMVVCVEAGLSFTAAIHRIVEENKSANNPLYEELKLMTQEFLIGKSKADAFRNLAERTGVDDIRSLAITLIQAEKLGTSIADSLRVLADSMRFKRRQRAEELANKTSVKLVFPLVLLIFPELMVILVGPAMITLFKTFTDVVNH